MQPVNSLVLLMLGGPASFAALPLTGKRWAKIQQHRSLHSRIRMGRGMHLKIPKEALDSLDPALVKEYKEFEAKRIKIANDLKQKAIKKEDMT